MGGSQIKPGKAVTLTRRCNDEKFNKPRKKMQNSEVNKGTLVLGSNLGSDLGSDEKWILQDKR